jgi:hypothetical protein
MRVVMAEGEVSAFEVQEDERQYKYRDDGNAGYAKNEAEVWFVGEALLNVHFELDAT